MLAHRQPMISSVRRDAWVEVDLNAIERNIAVIRSWSSPETRLMAVVKSDAYGHGAAAVSEVAGACGADWLGVASVDEGCQLRAAGVRLPVLLLGPCPVWAIGSALDAGLTLSVTSSAELADIEGICRKQKRQKIGLHLKIDTGMHRLGIAPNKLGEFLERLKECQAVGLSGVFSHLAMADDKDFTAMQTAAFEKSIQEIRAAGQKPSLLHLASGEAARRFPQTHYSMVRTGIYLYGLEPRGASELVYPALSVKGRINQIRELEKDEAVGYNLTWKSDVPTRIASIPIGYADGVDRCLSNRISGLLMGRKVKQVGMISMDQMLFDVGNVPEAQEGDVVTLIGCESVSGQSIQIHLAEWAQMLDTITYELACRLRVRMPRVYTRNAFPPQMLPKNEPERI